MHSDLDTDLAWEKLRASRSNPPGRANTGARRRTYSAALEQAGQMFRAAAVVDPATRPLQIFYGLSQAGRAIAAASWSLKGQDWNLESHGIKATGFHLAFPDIEIRTDSSGTQGSFVRVSEVLGSPVWGTDPVRLEDVWDLLPPNLDYPLTTRDRLTPLQASDVIVGDYAHPLLSVSVHDFPKRVIDAGTREALADFLTAYPAIAQHDSYSTVRGHSPGTEAPPNYTRFDDHDDEGSFLTINWQMPQGPATTTERREYLRNITRPYDKARYFLPVLPLMKKELHPLMAWWAVLYALSMLARYQPATWVKLISVDDSQHALPIERLLERAITHLPLLIADSITEVSAGTPA